MFGGYKGLVFVVMVELFGGVLIGDMMSWELMDFDEGVGVMLCYGEFVIVFDLKVFFGDEFDMGFVCGEWMFELIVV